jgi:hypothetical protein
MLPTNGLILGTLHKPPPYIWELIPLNPKGWVLNIFMDAGSNLGPFVAVQNSHNK